MTHDPEPPYDPADEEHVKTASRVATAQPNMPIGNAEKAKPILQALVSTFQRMLSVDTAAAVKWYRLAVSNLHVRPELQKCDQLSFVLALLQCAELGLMPGPTTGHAYLIPFNDRRKKLPQVQLIPGYKGLIHCAYRSGEIDGVTADVVYEHDEFSCERGTKPFIHHVPDFRQDPGKLLYAYVVVHVKGSAVPTFKVIDARQAMAAKARSRGSQSDFSPWNSSDTEPAMWMKTAFRRIVPWIPMSYEMRRLLDIEASSEDKEEVKRAALSREAFMGQKEEPKPAELEAPSSLDELPKAPRKRKEAAREPEAAPEPPEAHEVPRAAGDDSAEVEHERLLNQIEDLRLAIEQKQGRAPNLPGNLEGFPLPELRRLASRLAASLEAMS